MAEMFSTGLRQFLLGEGSFRKFSEDVVIDYYAGSTPASANDAVTAFTKLVRITKSSGAVIATDRGTPRVYKITVPNATLGNTVILNVTVDGVGPTAYTYTFVAADTTDILGARKIAQMLSDIPQVMAIGDPDATGPAILWVQGRIDGLDLTIANGGGTTTATVTAKVAASRPNTLQFGPPASGEIDKNSDTWSGVNLASGTAGFFRIVRPDDDGTLSTTALRFQGAISTSGAELNGTSVNLVVDAVTTISELPVTFPES